MILNNIVRSISKYMTLKPQNGFIQLCMYCGEQVGNSRKYCKECTTKNGRENILAENVAILGELRKKGYCKDKVELRKP